MLIGSLVSSGISWAKRVAGIENSCIRDEQWDVAAKFTVSDDGRSVVGFLRGGDGRETEFNGVLEDGNIYHRGEQGQRGDLIGVATHRPVSLLNVGGVVGSFLGAVVFLGTGGYYGGIRRKYNDDRQGCCHGRKDVGWISPAAYGLMALSVVIGSGAWYLQHHIPAANTAKEREEVEWLKWGADIAAKAALGLLSASVVASAAELELRVKRLCCREDSRYTGLSLSSPQPSNQPSGNLDVVEEVVCDGGRTGGAALAS